MSCCSGDSRAVVKQEALAMWTELSSMQAFHLTLVHVQWLV